MLHFVDPVARVCIYDFLVTPLEVQSMLYIAPDALPVRWYSALSRGDAAVNWERRQSENVVDAVETICDEHSNSTVPLSSRHFLSHSVPSSLQLTTLDYWLEGTNPKLENPV